MNKTAFDINPTLLQFAMGIPTAGIGGALGYYAAPKEHRIEGMARGAGMGYMTGTGMGIGARLGDAAAPEGQTHTQNIPYMLAGGLTGGALGLGAGKMLQGTPAWEERRKFREELLNLLQEESRKIKHEIGQHRQPPEVLTPLLKQSAGPALSMLLEAKALSDKKRYKGKHDRLRHLIDRYPDDFFIDSMNNRIAGITHRPTGFRIHAPINILPTSFREMAYVPTPAA